MISINVGETMIQGVIAPIRDRFAEVYEYPRFLWGTSPLEVRFRFPTYIDEEARFRFI